MAKNWARPATLAAACALALTGCGGGGGGSNVKSNPPPAGGGTPVEPLTVTTANLVVAPGESVTKPVMLYTINGSIGHVDNAGSIGGASIDVAIAANTYYGGAIVLNHAGGKINGRQYALKVGHLTLTNEGAGSAIRSDGTAVRAETGQGIIANTDGASIIGGNAAISVEHGGNIFNSAGSTIATTGSVQGDCGAGGSCAIYASPNTLLGETQDTRLVNAGLITGNVQLAPDAMNSVLLEAGGVIQGNLDMGHNSASDLTLEVGAGTTQAASQAVTGQTTFSGYATKTGEGTWILDNDMLAAASQLSLTTGSILVTDPGAVGQGMLSAGDGLFIFDLAQDATLDSVFYGGSSESPGMFVKRGADELTIREGNLSFEPHFRIEDGTLRIIGDGSSNSAYVENNGSLVLEGGLTSYLTNFVSVSGTGSLLKTGSGNAMLANSSYTGGTTIEGGGLGAWDVVPGDVAIRPGGTLGFIAMNPIGVPGVAGNVVNDGTIIAADVATRIEGDYHQSSTGTLAVELGGRIEVAGTATLDGGTLEVRGVDVSFIPDAHTELLTADGGLSGTFDRLVETSNDLVLASTTIYYDDHSVWLDTSGIDISWALTADGVGYTAASANSAQRVQSAFDALNERFATRSLAGVSGDFLHAAGRFQRAPSIEAAQASLRSLSGELHAASAAMTFRAIDASNQALSEHLDGVRDGHASLGMWTKQLGSGGGMARSGFDGVGFQLDGWLVGNDFRVGGSGVVGLAFGQGQGLQQLQDGFDRDSSRRTEGMVYAGLTGDRWYAQGRLGFGQFRQDVSRALLLGDGAEGVWTRYDGRYQVAYGESGLRYGVGDLRVAPFASVEYARSDRDAFAEAGAGGFGLRSDAQSQARWQASVGVRASHRWSFGKDRALDLGAHAQWFRASAADAGAMEASFVGLEQWSPLLGIGLSRYGGLFGVGLDARLSSNATLKVGYDYEHGQFDDAHGMSAGLKLAF